jgi:uncharacterized membrane protein
MAYTLLQFRKSEISSWIRRSAVLGFTVGGFFNGILLHQKLHHHLRSLEPGVADMRMQVLWDGNFHVNLKDSRLERPTGKIF